LTAAACEEYHPILADARRTSRNNKENRMPRSAHFFVVVVVVFAILTIQPLAAQQTAHPDLSLSAVGVATNDYAASMNFYTKIMGFRPAFSFSPNGKAHNTYFQVSRDTFLELQQASANNPPGLTHIHMHTGDVDALVARLRKAGIPPCTDSVKTACITDPRIAKPTQERNAVIVDPNGIRIEPTEFTPNSLTRKAVDSWHDTTPATRLLVVGIGVKDYPASENFYGKLLGFPVAFKFTSPDGKRTTTYYQISRDTFLEMQALPADGHAITHVHIETSDLNATIAKLREAGLESAPRNSTVPNRVTEPGITRPSNVKSANVFDPNGIRLELNELLPDSLTRKAMESWK
jgi:catechol 2,3-dioxygenase-like lactoylglutathione lyase family enzyme